MSKKIIINVADHETRVALVEDETIVELFIERKGSRDNTGNIYKGRVQRVLPGMQAAFVDIGLNQAFIYVAGAVAASLSFNEKFNNRFVFNESDPGFVVGHVDNDFFSHDWFFFW